MEKTWQQKDGRWYLGGRLIENPAGYGAVCQARFLSEERRKDDRRPIHFSLDRPIPAEYNKPIIDRDIPYYERRVNAWGMPIADDQPLNGLEFYRLRASAFEKYMQESFGIKIDRDKLLYYIELLFRSVKECREQGPLAVRRRFSELSGMASDKGRISKFIDLLQDVAASPGWFARSREGAEIPQAVVTDILADDLWKHPRARDLRRGFRSFIPERRPHRAKKSPSRKKK